jgi:predicted esterase
MQEHHIEVTRTARYFTLGDPVGGVEEVWFACHGYAQLAGRFLEKLRALDDGRRYVVAPEGLSRFYLTESPTERRVGATWMTREDRLSEIDDYVRYLDALYREVLGRVQGPAARVTALGFSQGTATVSRWAALGQSRIDHVILWGGELPPDLDLAAARDRLRDVRFTLVYGERDEYITRKVVDTMVARLREHDLAHRVYRFDGAHEVDDTILRRLAGRE